jgi:predicted phosphoribosyltransferase
MFRDREEAGRRLGARLTSYRDHQPIILALPRGGGVGGEQVARALEAPLDVIGARKIGAPGFPEFGIGAVGPGGARILDEGAIAYLDVTQAQLAKAVEAERREMERRLHHYRGDRPLPDLHGRTVILVDDGLATGVTARAAVQAIWRQWPLRLVLAVPVAARETAAALRLEVDDLVCLAAPPDFQAVSLWYEEFPQVTDEEVIAILERNCRLPEAVAA